MNNSPSTWAEQNAVLEWFGKHSLELCKMVSAYRIDVQNRASKAAELAATDSQQLQAKIRAIADGLEVAYRTADPMAVDNAVNELRELSAVQ